MESIGNGSGGHRTKWFARIYTWLILSIESAPSLTCRVVFILRLVSISGTVALEDLDKAAEKYWKLAEGKYNAYETKHEQLVEHPRSVTGSYSQSPGT